MSYSTGEIAKLCNVTVRTVQFYDREGLLKPEGFSEGGRRLYGENSLKTLQIICAYRNLGLPLADVKRILSDEQNSRKILLSVLGEREKTLDEEIIKKLSQRDSVRVIKKSVAEGKAIPPSIFYDVKTVMQKDKKLKKLRLITAVCGITATCAEITVVALWAAMGLWIPFAAVMPCVFIGVGVLTAVYYKRTQYVCTDCGKKFKPGFGKFFFSAHTPNTRRLTCPHCGAKNYHTEIYAD